MDRGSQLAALGRAAQVRQLRELTAICRWREGAWSGVAQVTRAVGPPMVGTCPSELRHRDRSPLNPMILMNHDAYDDAYIAGILSRVRSFAFIGASANESRPSYFAMKYLLAKGYTVVPVNLGHDGGAILGQTVYKTLADVPAPIDVVDVFRNSEAALAITREAIAHKDRLGLSVVWMQLSVRNDVAAAEAEAAGIQVVMNRCPKIEYGRLSGEIGWAGYNTGSISSKRPMLQPGGVQRHRIGTRE
jgi:predicted CoA-binding protein